MAAKSYDSGEWDSSHWKNAEPAEGTEERDTVPAPPPATSNLMIALRYWPGRWPRAVVYGFLVTEPFLRPMSPDDWVEMLDTRSAILIASGMLLDATTFP